MSAGTNPKIYLYKFFSKIEINNEEQVEGKKMKDHRDENEKRLESGWAGPGVEVWPEEDDYVMWRSMRMNARRHLECSIPALASSPFCGKGYHNG